MYDKHTLNIDIGECIKQARIDAGFTQQQLAELIGRSSPNLSAVERGAVGISNYALLRICDVLCVTTDAILLGINEASDISRIIKRLEHISPENLILVEDIINTLLKVVAANSASQNQ